MMRIKLIKKNPLPELPNTTPLDRRYGFWGNVTAVDSKKMKVKVRAATGYEYIGIPVCSNEWVNKDDNDNFSGSRNLPPVGARVFVFTPTGTITGAFVLCSGYAQGDTKTHDLFEENKENERKTVTVNGWTKIEDVENSKMSLTSKNEKIKLEFIPDGDSAKINIKAFNLSISVSDNSINIDGTDNITLTSSQNINVDTGSKNVTFKTNNFAVTKDGSTNLLEVS